MGLFPIFENAQCPQITKGCACSLHRVTLVTRHYAHGPCLQWRWWLSSHLLLFLCVISDRGAHSLWKLIYRLPFSTAMVTLLLMCITRALMRQIIHKKLLLENDIGWPSFPLDTSEVSVLLFLALREDPAMGFSLSSRMQHK